MDRWGTRDLRVAKSPLSPWSPFQRPSQPPYHELKPQVGPSPDQLGGCLETGQTPRPTVQPKACP